MDSIVSAVGASTPPHRCVACGGATLTVRYWIGGRGYVPFVVCVLDSEDRAKGGGHTWIECGKAAATEGVTA